SSGAPSGETSSRTAAVSWLPATAIRALASAKRTGTFRWRAVASIFDRKKVWPTQATIERVVMGPGILSSENLDQVDGDPVQPPREIEPLLNEKRTLDINLREKSHRGADAVAAIPRVKPPVVRVVRTHDGIALHVL